MFVYIGPHIYRWTSRVHDRYMDKKYGHRGWTESTTAFEEFLEKLEDTLQSVYNATVNKYIDKKQRKIKVNIHPYDTWGMDDTLALIILPMLKQLNDTKHGAPYVDDADVPDELKSTFAPPKENDYDTDDNHFKRWDWVMSEMIWAFEQKQLDWELQYYGEWIEDKSKTLGGHFVNVDREGLIAHQKRMSNGFRLFGRYFEALWD